MTTGLPSNRAGVATREIRLSNKTARNQTRCLTRRLLRQGSQEQNEGTVLWNETQRHLTQQQVPSP